MLECSEPIQIVSVFEWGLQPLTAGTAAQYLEAHDYPVRVTDIFIDGFEAENYRRAWLVAIAVPVFDALAGAVSVAAKIKETNPLAHITFFGQYATVQHTQLVPVHGDSAICGDWEEPLRQLARALANGDTTSEIDGVYLGSGSPPKYWARDVIARPARHLLPQLLRYNTVDTDHGTELKSVIAGNVEVTRGCHHDCSYCAVFAAYGRKVILIPQEVVLDDIRALVAQGANHIVFVDADFLNAWKYSKNTVERMHDEFPNITFEYTTRVDHILEHRSVVAELREMGCTRITSAFEFPTDKVLQTLHKNCTVADLEEATRFCQTIGQDLNPTFILFNPWVSPDDLLAFDDFIQRNQLQNAIEPIQYETRLMLYKGSPLLSDPLIQTLQLTEHEFHYDWAHPDPLMDEIYLSRAMPAEAGVFKRCCLKC